ncbi:MAG: sulfatase [Planctomycetes bacterium]|nr:sulfatase [Planctomycetota bacterium]
MDSANITRAVCLACWCLPGCAPEAPPPAPPRPKPNVILITVDTLRADHLSCYGHHRPTSPNIDRFAAGATRFTRAMATSPWTIPTHGSLLTGKLPFEHGAHTVKVREPVNNVRTLPLENVTLAEVLAGEGYRTGAFVANDGYLSAGSQFDQGFGTYHVDRVYGHVLNREVFKWLEADPQQPFFLFVNYIDTHRPYNTALRPGFIDPPAVQDQGQLVDRLYQRVMPGIGPIPPDLVAMVKDQYDTSVANLDAQIGALFDRLQTLGHYDRTVIVLTSDHGEYFGEHHLVEHSKDVYQEVLWVPLIVKGVGQERGRVIETPVSSTDVPNLIFAEFPKRLATRYRKLFPDAPGNHEIIAENYYTRTEDLFNPTWGHRFDRIRTVIIDWPHKFILSSDDRHELYDLAADPRESQNLVESRGELANKLAARIRRVQSLRRRYEDAALPQPLTEEQRRRLQGLGYIGQDGATNGDGP